MQPESFTQSAGHIGLNTFNGTTYEYYIGPDGDLFRAPIHNVIDVRTGYRIGRWEAPARLVEKVLFMSWPDLLPAYHAMQDAVNIAAHCQPEICGYPTPEQAHSPCILPAGHEPPHTCIGEPTQ